MVFSYSVWVLRDFPEDGLKVGVVETGTLPLRFLVQCMELRELNVRSHVLMLNPIKCIIYIFCVQYCGKISSRWSRTAFQFFLCFAILGIPYLGISS